MKNYAHIISPKYISKNFTVFEMIKVFELAYSKMNSDLLNTFEDC
jgi:hypothetical protein